MSLSQDKAIVGSLVLVLSDQLRAQFWHAPHRYRIYGIIYILVFTFLATGVLLGENPYSIVGIALIGLSIWIILLFCFIAIAFRRYSNQQKQTTYEINSEQIVTRDAAGAAIVIPWNMIRRVTERNLGFAISLNPFGTRWIPKRAFTADAIVAFRNMMKEKLGEAAKLRA